MFLIFFRKEIIFLKLISYLIARQGQQQRFMSEEVISNKIELNFALCRSRLKLSMIFRGNHFEI
jgi:hypothetical protein